MGFWYDYIKLFFVLLSPIITLQICNYTSNPLSKSNFTVITSRNNIPTLCTNETMQTDGGVISGETVTISFGFIFPYGIVFDCEVVYDIGMGFALDRFSMKLLKIMSINRIMRVTYVAYILSHSHSSTFYHFMVESLPKLLWRYNWLLLNKDVALLMINKNGILTGYIS